MVWRFIGGFAGATVMVALRMGVFRGIFSNESGLGFAPIAHALPPKPTAQFAKAL